jgi:hypothetical protein
MKRNTRNGKMTSNTRKVRVRTRTKAGLNGVH